MTSYDTSYGEHGQDLNIGAIVTTGIAFVVLTAVSIMFLYGLYLRTEHAENARKATGLADEFFELKQAQLLQLATSGWIDETAGIARIPIEEAIGLTLEEYGEPRDAQTGSGEPGGISDVGATQNGNDDPLIAGGDSHKKTGRPGE